MNMWTEDLVLPEELRKELADMFGRMQRRYQKETE